MAEGGLAGSICRGARPCRAPAWVWDTWGDVRAQGPPGLSWLTHVCLVQRTCPWSGSSLPFSIGCSSASLRRDSCFPQSWGLAVPGWGCPWALAAVMPEFHMSPRPPPTTP